jgi:hypothetical protein
MTTANIKSKTLVLVSLTLFIISLMKPAFESSSGGLQSGLDVLKMALHPLILILSIVIYPLSICWYANISIILCWIFLSFNNKKRAIYFSILSVILSSIFFFFYKFVPWPSEIRIAYDTELRVGYWFWLASMMVACLASFLMDGKKPTSASNL